MIRKHSIAKEDIMRQLEENPLTKPVKPFLMPGDDEVTEINTDWLNDDCIMTLKERQEMRKRKE